MKINKTIFFSIFFSFIIHILFFVASANITLESMNNLIDEKPRIFKLRKVDKTVDNINLFEDKEDDMPIKKVEKEISENKVEFKEMDNNEVQDLYMETKKDYKERQVLKEFSLEQLDNLEYSELMFKEKAKVNKDIMPKTQKIEDSFISKENIDFITSEASDVLLEPNVGNNYFNKGAMVLNVDKRCDSLASIENSKEINEFESDKQMSQVTKYDNIDDYLDIDLFKYISKDKKEKFFKIVIKVRKNVKMDILPKEIIFLLDSSKSITSDRFFLIKSTMSSILNNFNSNDSFNIIAFKKDIIKLSEQSININTKSISEVESFIKDLESKGQTDVENALLDIIETEKAKDASYIILITDGRPTIGLLDSKRIIQQITRNNNKKRSMFCFGVGKKVNKYLLDFIAYQNRGCSDICLDKNIMEEDFYRFCNQLKNPILTNIRYNLLKVDKKDVYPKYLPDFYKEKEFVLYGRFNNEKEFSVQILGNINGKIKEFIFTRNFENAKIGTQDIAKQWAFRKIYYLISQDTLFNDDSISLNNNIRQLSEKYGIKTPYFIEEDTN